MLLARPVVGHLLQEAVLAMDAWIPRVYLVAILQSLHF